MKLLCWMHRKFRQNANEALKALVIGQSMLDDHQQHFPKSTYGSRPFKQGQREHTQLRNSFTGLDTARGEEDDYEDESISELFHGFLAIGTLGSEQMMNDHPGTPTFAISMENITEKDNQNEVTENELKVINDELEKVLGAELPDDGFNDSSGRNSHVSAGRSSHVSAGRSSHGSVITLTGKPDEGGAVCPLQGYLFGSAIELSETTATSAVKKENRTSLSELFQRTKLSDDIAKSEREEKRTEKEAEKSALINLMKKKLKKKLLHAVSRSSSSSGQSDPAPTETKLHKILHMFHRKVHPETSAAELKSAKPQKSEPKKKSDYDGSCNYELGQIPTEEDIMMDAVFLKHKIQRYRSQSNPPQFDFSNIDSDGNREQWIKTDADYLVLEL